MAYYNQSRYKKSYKLGSKPPTVLKKTTERNLILDIEKMNEEILKLERLRNLLSDYKTRRIAYDHDYNMNLELNTKFKQSLIVNPNNYKSGLIYFFVKKELKDEIKNKIELLDASLRNISVSLGKKHSIEVSPVGNFKLNIKEIEQRFFGIERTIKDFNLAITNYRKELERKQNKNQRIEEIKGLAAQAINKTREQARQIKSNIVNNEFCPYCGVYIIDAHLDHIYPVAKGGLSTTKNMVRVCSDCNLKKKALTLSQFIKKNELDRDFIESNLEKLNKIY